MKNRNHSALSVLLILIIFLLNTSLSTHSVFATDNTTLDNEFYIDKVEYLKGAVENSTNDEFIESTRVEIVNTIEKIKDKNLRNEEMKKLEQVSNANNNETELITETETKSIGSVFFIFTFLLFMVSILLSLTSGFRV